MMLQPENIISLLSLTALETVLGIDNIIFLSILVGKLPYQQQATARRTGLILALGMRVLLLLTLSWLASLREPWFWLLGRGISGRDLVLILGGGFLLFKSGRELFAVIEGEEEHKSDDTPSKRKSMQNRALVWILVQIVLMDIVFSIDSVITAVGLAPHVGIMIAAMVLSMLVMLIFAKSIGEFVERNPSMKVLALSFLILVGMLLLAEGWEQKIAKGYVYFAMAFSFVVQLLNIRMQQRAAAP